MMHCKVLGYLGYLFLLIAASGITTPDKANATEIAGSNSLHACEIRSTGALYCWGSGSKGLGLGSGIDIAPIPTQVGSSTGWTSVSTGSNSFSCGIDSGELYCWGTNTYGQLGTGNTTSYSTPTQVGAASNWSDVSGGLNHACAINTSGQAYCWGDNTTGQLGDGTTTDRTSPTQVGSATDWVAIDAGNEHTCGIRYDGMTTWSLYCWGRNSSGQLGIGNTTNSSSPSQVTGSNWYKIRAGWGHTCARTTDEKLYCWGENQRGEVGDGTTTDRTSPVEIDPPNGGSSWIYLDAGYEQTCAVSYEGDLYCWGLNNHGQLGIGNTTNQSSPQLVDDTANWKQIAAGRLYSCFLDTSNNVYCTGENAEGQLGIGFQTSPFTETGSSVGGFATVATGYNHACGLSDSDELYCWGDNSYGQLGDGTTTDRDVPTQVGSNSDWLSIQTGAYFTCGTRDATEGETAFCWGLNNEGQLGIGSTTSQSSPSKVGSGSGDPDLAEGVFSRLTLGEAHACGYEDFGYGEWMCWGRNDYGQLGDNSTTDRTSPVGIDETDANLSGASAWELIAGGNHTCHGRRAGVSGNNLRCWGLNSSGQLGDNTTTNRLRPQSSTVYGDPNARDIGTGNDHTCYQHYNDSKLYCFGENGSGQLGDGSYTDSSIPVEITSTAVYGVDGGLAHTCARAGSSSGALYCWGYNIHQELGLSNNATQNTPQQVGSETDWISGESGVGIYFTCNIQDNSGDDNLYCWGRNVDSQLGFAAADETSMVQVH